MNRRHITIHTPEGIRFSYTLAGPFKRFLAWYLDSLLIMALVIVTGKIFNVFLVLSADIGRALSIVSYFLISFGYSIALEWSWQGQTLGKRMMKMRVMDINGVKLNFNQVVLRNVMRLIDSLPLFYMVGGLTTLFSRRWQRLGDFVAQTMVIETTKTEIPNLEQLRVGKYNTLRQYPQFIARLRKRVSVQETALAVQALLRRDSIAPEARVTLFEAIARFFKTKIPFPEEAIRGVTDEQLVRNVVECLFIQK